MRKWIGSKVARFGLWLENRAIGIQDFGFDIMPKSVLDDGAFTEMVTATLAATKSDMLAKVAEHNALYRRLTQKYGEGEG